MKFLIQDTFHKNEVTQLIFGKPVDKVHMEGTVSQIFYHTCFMKSRK